MRYVLKHDCTACRPIGMRMVLRTMTVLMIISFLLRRGTQRPDCRHEAARIDKRVSRAALCADCVRDALEFARRCQVCLVFHVGIFLQPR